jgi:hypothetical protein
MFFMAQYMGMPGILSAFLLANGAKIKLRAATPP